VSVNKWFHVKHAFENIVVGGGHAGVEASLASARMGTPTLLITMKKSAVARMSCNPAIGGLAKGHLVAEIDALGGEMAKVIDLTGIQFKMLNRSKGRAVWSPRAQADKIRYSLEFQRRLADQDNLTVLEDIVFRIITENRQVVGVETASHGSISCKTVIVTAGTFLNGLIHIGMEHFPGGRLGEKSACGLTKSLENLGIKSGRLKTGTPPRIRADSINYNNVTPQFGDSNPIPFSFQTKDFSPKNIPCYITHTTALTHKILRGGFNQSPLFSGKIKGVGPRYCPSIEDKIVRFENRDSHQIFLEPEWENANQIYVNGFSTSLPLETQICALRSIPGLENAEILKPGYAIEYDYFPSYQLKRTLESKLIDGLFLAGQVNGTSGYEEAAALGLMAGINASLKINKEQPFYLDRSEAYIGVLIDDLITKSPTEPYRMFTSSAEYRLLLRFDNADQRLSQKGYDLGLVEKYINESARSKRETIKDSIQYLQSTFVGPSDINPILSACGECPVSSSITLYKALCRPPIHIDSLLTFFPKDLTTRIRSYKSLDEQIEIDVKYAGYVQRQELQIQQLKKQESLKIPGDLIFTNIKSITKEAREKLSQIRPETIGQAARIPGVSPSDITALMILLKK